MSFDEKELALRERLAALPPAARAELLHVLRLPDLDRVERIGEFWGYPETRTFGELLIDLEEDRTLGALLVGPLRGRPSARSCPFNRSRRAPWEPAPHGRRRSRLEVLAP